MSRPTPPGQGCDLIGQQPTMMTLRWMQTQELLVDWWWEA